MNIFRRIKLIIDVTRTCRKMQKMTPEEQMVYIRNQKEAIERSGNAELIEVAHEIYEMHNEYIRDIWNEQKEMITKELVVFERIMKNADEYPQNRLDDIQQHINECNDRLVEYDSLIAMYTL